MIIPVVPAPPLPLLLPSVLSSPYRPACQHQENPHLFRLTVSTMNARMPMHATMARIFALLAFCIVAQPTAPAQPVVSAQPVLPSMPKAKEAKPKHKRTALDMRGKHHVSQKALSHIIKNIISKGMVKATSPRSMSRHRHALTNRDTPFGKLIQDKCVVTKKGGTIRIPFLHPAAMLWVCCGDRNEFKTFFSSVLEGQPRLRIVQYTDEVTPRRELISYNDKNIWVLYWSFLESGRAALANEDAWFTGAVVRSHMVRNQIAGGMGQIFKVYNKMFFSEGFDFRSGIQ